MGGSNSVSGIGDEVNKRIIEKYFKLIMLLIMFLIWASYGKFD